MLVGEQASIMLLSRETWAQFSKLPQANPTTHALALYCFGVESREEVDTVVDAAAASGAIDHDDARLRGTRPGSGSATRPAASACGAARRCAHGPGNAPVLRLPFAHLGPYEVLRAVRALRRPQAERSWRWSRIVRGRVGRFPRAGRGPFVALAVVLGKLARGERQERSRLLRPGTTPEVSHPGPTGTRWP
jgi:hypothetical protein